METIRTILQNGGYGLILAAAVLIIYIPIMIVMRNKAKRRSAEFIAATPNAARMTVKNHAGRTTVYSINEDKPVFALERRGKVTYYLMPGENVISLSHAKTRPGIFYRTVTTTYGPVSISVTAEPERAYIISFDKKEKEFIFEQA